MTMPHAEQGEGLDCRCMGSVLAVPPGKLTLFVRRASQQWVVLDAEGNFWILPRVENSWEQRQPFYPTEENELEPVPGHYKYMLGPPFG